VTPAEQAWRLFDDLAHRYNVTYPFFTEFGRQLVDYADPTPGARLLDVGAGRGAVTKPALTRGCTITAIDAAPRMVALLASDMPQITVRKMDASRLEFPDASFDIVTAGMVVDILHDPAAVLSEIHRVLVPNGTFALSLAGPVHDRWQWLIQLAAEFEQHPPPNTAITPKCEYVSTLLTEAGFVEPTCELTQVIHQVPDPSALWDQFMCEGLAEWVTSLPTERATEFRNRVIAGAEHMHANGGITRCPTAILYRAQRPH
jgi:ubiquinone/menaquinone biosynthesis C-methylase UbiE